MNPKEMWDAYTKVHPEAAVLEYEAWTYGCDPDDLARLTVIGYKKATSAAFELYEAAGESLPQAGDYSIVLWSDGSAACIICTTKVAIMPFRDVPEEFAWKEGEGDRTLGYWRAVHENFFSDALKQMGGSFSEEMKVVCEEFEVVFTS